MGGLSKNDFWVRVGGGLPEWSSTWTYVSICYFGQTVSIYQKYFDIDSVRRIEENQSRKLGQTGSNWGRKSQNGANFGCKSPKIELK